MACAIKALHPTTTCKRIQFNTREYGKNLRQAHHRKRKHLNHDTCDGTSDREQIDTLASCILAACPASEIKHFGEDRADVLKVRCQRVCLHPVFGDTHNL